MSTLPHAMEDGQSTQTQHSRLQEMTRISLYPNLTELHNNATADIGIGENVKRHHNPSREYVLTDYERTLMDIIYILDEFGVPTTLAIGVILNIIVAITVRNSELKKVPSCCYFLSMGIVDTLYLIAMSVPWLSVRTVDFYNREGFCQLVYYLNLLTTFLSSWYVVMMLFERVLLSYRKAKTRKVCNAFRTKTYITIVSVLSIVSHLYLTWTSGVYVNGNQRTCTVIAENVKHIMVIRQVDIVFSFILPMVICCVLLILLIVYICTHYIHCKDRLFAVSTKRLSFEVRVHMRQVRNEPTSPLVTTELNPSRIQKAKLQAFIEGIRLSVVTLIIACVYILFFVPHNVIKSRITFLTSSYNVTLHDRLYLKLFEELYKINFAYKGFIYFGLIPEMRQNLVKILSKCTHVFRRQSPKENSIRKV